MAPKNCSFCFNFSGSRKDLNQHSNKEHLNEISKVWFSCSNCNIYFPSESSMKSHQRFAHQRFAHQRNKTLLQSDHCRFCSKPFSYRGRLRIHIWKFHVDEISDIWHSCSRCELWFETRAAAKKHEEDKHKLNYEKIRFVPKSVEVGSRSVNLRSDEQIRKKIRRRQVERSLLKRHQIDKSLRIQLSRSEIKKWLKCEKCRSYFQSSETFELHRQTFHKIYFMTQVEDEFDQINVEIGDEIDLDESDFEADDRLDTDEIDFKNFDKIDFDTGDDNNLEIIDDMQQVFSIKPQQKSTSHIVEHHHENSSTAFIPKSGDQFSIDRIQTGVKPLNQNPEILCVKNLRVGNLKEKQFSCDETEDSADICFLEMKKSNKRSLKSAKEQGLDNISKTGDDRLSRIELERLVRTDDDEVQVVERESEIDIFEKVSAEIDRLANNESVRCPTVTLCFCGISFTSVAELNSHILVFHSSF